MGAEKLETIIERRALSTHTQVKIFSYSREKGIKIQLQLISL
jgi:hypothetical protein